MFETNREKKAHQQRNEIAMHIIIKAPLLFIHSTLEQKKKSEKKALKHLHVRFVHANKDVKHTRIHCDKKKISSSSSLRKLKEHTQSKKKQQQQNTRKKNNRETKFQRPKIDF